MPAVLNPVLDLLTIRGTVTEAEQLTARIRRLRIESGQLVGLEVQPGQQVRVLVGGLTLRTYSIWHYDPSGVVELCVLDHAAGGPGARWGHTVAPGEQVRLRRPEGTFTLRPDASHHLFVGDETASVAFGAMLAALPGDAAVSGCIETAAATDRLPLPCGDRLDWVLRGETSLPDAVRRLAPAPGGIAYVAGEARDVQAVRQVLRAAGWDRRAVLTKPFWTPGKKGME
ncbi:siderophore-interacting protein [Streptomyces albidoflavus]|uniref:siderophore-interacting protein n=1 Tax=Streptomyces albidoflavus TaxID=1886 RepID=UPI00101E7E2C|nr:siderophore-interacting protein [Streptomyces albidoflavus]RZD90876.1 NADPH-dependent ferric siderophore reductase [Streptomyces albidoflavus]